MPFKHAVSDEFGWPGTRRVWPRRYDRNAAADAMTMAAREAMSDCVWIEIVSDGFNYRAFAVVVIDQFLRCSAL